MLLWAAHYLDIYYFNNMQTTASLKIIKSELEQYSTKELITIITTVAKFKKENKELLTYLLFNSKDEADYIKEVKLEIDTTLEPVNRYNARFMLKLIRKTLRLTRKAIKFSGKPETEVQLLLHFCSVLKKKDLPCNRLKALDSIVDRLVLNITKSIKLLHEDLRYDYSIELREILPGRDL